MGSADAAEVGEEACVSEDIVDALGILPGASMVPRNAAVAALEEALGHHGISPSRPWL